MGMHVAAVDVAPAKLQLARSLGADLAIDACQEDAVAGIQKEIRGAHGVLVTAVSPSAFSQALRMLRRGGTMALVGLPPGDFPVPIFDVVIARKTIRGSIVGTRADLAECLEFAAEGKAMPTYTVDKLENINDIFSRMRAGAIDGRIVMEI
jgi:propanol-preferring alcohol dehydrogenase